ncbi:MAG: hypothetical protein J1F65_01845 [Clostridiales bacterium]|nr:hypothetical protein [Clostridiales bacterium]
MKRKILIAVLTVLCIVSCILLVACDNAQDVLDTRLIVQQNGKTVSSPFTLPRYLGENNEYELNWTADKPNSLSLTQQAETWLATPIAGDTRETVTLTASVGRATKTFTVIVKPINAFYFLDEYQFEQEGRNVYDDFDVPTQLTYNNRTAQLTWSIADTYSNVATMGDVNSAEHTQHVNVTVLKGQDVKVKIGVEITYNGDTVPMEYQFIVTEYKDHAAGIAAWYETQSGNIDVSGYVVGIAQPYAATYGNASIYAVDDDGCHGFYLYQIKMSSADGELLAPGMHFTASSVPCSPYNGLIEGKGGELVIDTDVTPIDPDSRIHAFDNDAIGKVPAANYYTGSLVSLTNWKIKSVASSKPAAGKAATVLTLTNGNVDVTVATSNYMQGFYAAAEGNEIWEGLCALRETYQKDQVVSVTGVLSKYNSNYQILPRSTADVTLGTEAATYTDGTNAAKAISAVNTYLKNNGLDGTVAVTKDFNLPTSNSGVTISYRLCAIRDTISLDGAKLSIVPGDAESLYLEAKYTIGSYTTYSYHLISAEKLSDEKIVEKVKANLDSEILKEFYIDKSINLPTDGTSWGFQNVTITWAFDGSTPSWATLTGGKLTVTLDNQSHTGKLVASISLNSVNDQAEINLVVSAKVFEEMATPVAGDYKLALFQANKNAWYFVIPQMDGNFIKMTTDAAQAGTVTLAGSESDGWTLQIGGKYIEPNEDGSISQVKLADSSSATWKWDSELGTFTWTISAGKTNAGKIVYLGTYGTFETLSASETSRISGSNASAVGVTQFVAHLGRVLTGSAD